MTPLHPEQTFLLGLKRHMQIQTCDWADIEADIARIAAGLRAELPVIQPLPALALLDDPGLQRQAASAWIREECRPAPMLEPIPRKPRGARIRIWLLLTGFPRPPARGADRRFVQSHDRARFEVTAFAFGPDTRDEMRTRLERAFDRLG